MIHYRQSVKRFLQRSVTTFCCYGFVFIICVDCIDVHFVEINTVNTLFLPKSMI